MEPSSKSETCPVILFFIFIFYFSLTTLSRHIFLCTKLKYVGCLYIRIIMFHIIIDYLD